MRVTLKLGLSQYELMPLQVYQRYVNQVNLGQYQYFQVNFTPKQISTLSFSSITLTLTLLNGRGELYASTRNRNPQYGQAEFSSYSLSPVQTITVNVTSVKDLSQYSLFVGVYGGTQAQYQLKVDAQASALYPASTT